MTIVYYKTDKTDTSGPVGVYCTPDGRIDFSLLGEKFGFDPKSIELNGGGFPIKELESQHKWEEIRDAFKEDELPVGAKDDPVVVTGEAAVPAVSTGPGNHQSITRQQLLKQELPGLRLAFSNQPGLRNVDIPFYPESVKMWKSFREDVADHVAALASSSDEGPFTSPADFGDVPIYRGSDVQSVSAVYQNLLVAVLRLHKFPECTIAPSQRFSASSLRAYRANFSPASAMVLENAHNSDSRQFAPDWMLTLHPGHTLLIEYKETSFFRQSTSKPLPDLVSAYADYSQHGGNAQRKSLVLAEAVRQVYKYMSKLRIGYAVMSSADATYLVRRVDGADPAYQNCMEISEGYAWASKDPALLEALSYIMNRTADDEKKFEFQNAAEPETVLQESQGAQSEEDQISQDPDVKVKVTKGPKINRVYNLRKRKRKCDLPEIAAADLHLEACRFATGWSGNIVRGRIDHHRVAVKLAPMFSVRAEALINEARAYNRLKQYWGLYFPELLSHGTTVNGEVVYIATKLVSGFPIGIERVTKAVVASAFEALNAVHASGMLHGDIRDDNILVTEGSVRLIDFGFSVDSSCKEDYMKEREQLEDIICQFYSRVRRTDRLTGNNRIITVP